MQNFQIYAETHASPFRWMNHCQEGVWILRTAFYHVQAQQHEIEEILRLFSLIWSIKWKIKPGKNEWLRCRWNHTKQGMFYCWKNPTELHRVHRFFELLHSSPTWTCLCLLLSFNSHFTFTSMSQPTLERK